MSLHHMDIYDELVGTEGDSHLHYDHAGGIRWFSEHAPIHCQQRDLDHALAQTAPEPQALCRIDFDDHRID